MKRLRTYQKYLKIRKKFHELLKTSATDLTKKLNQLNSEKIWNRSKNASKSNSLIKNITISCCSFFFSSEIFWNSDFIIFFFSRFKKLSCFCNRSWRDNDFWIFFRSRSRFFFKRRYLIKSKNVKSHRLLSRMHSTHLSKFAFILHSLKKQTKKQILQKRLIRSLKIARFTITRRHWIENFWIFFRDI